MTVERIPADTWADYPDHVQRYEYALQQIRIGEVVNDIACGVGYGAVILGSAVGGYRGFDRPSVPDPRFLEALAGKDPAEFLWCDLNDPAWRPPPADVTVSHATLEHVEDPVSFARVLVATTRRALVVSAPVVPTKAANPWHLHDFTAEEIPPLFAPFVVTDTWEQPDALCQVWLLERP